MDYNIIRKRNIAGGEKVNKLKIGASVFSIHHSDGKAHPTHYWLEEKGKVTQIAETKIDKTKFVEWKKEEQMNSLNLGHCEYEFSEARMLAPSIDGFCYYMAELPDMEQYKDGELYKVPTNVLKKHMRTYKSPWEE